MKTKVVFVCAAAALLSISAFAQDNSRRFGLELNGGAAMATSRISEEKANPGFGFEGILQYRVLPFTAIYGGWGWNRLVVDESFAGTDARFEETGYVFGLQFRHPVGKLPMNYFLRAGGLYNHIEIENTDGDIIHDSGHGLGWQVAGGLDINLGSKWSLAPGVKFNSLTTEINDEGIIRPISHNYLSVRVGIIKRF